MSNAIPAPANTCVLVLDRSDRSVIRIPIVAFDIVGTIAYPIAPIAFRGLLKAERAMEVNGYIVDRGFDIPFDSEEAWVQWAMSTTPGEDAEPEMAETAMAEDLAFEHTAANGPGPAETKVKAERPDKPRKTFKSNSWWMRTRMDGMAEIVQIDGGHGLPRDHEGWEKIKREEFFDFKKLTKGDEPTYILRTWVEDGLVEGDDEQVEQEDDEDYGGLV